MHVGVDEAGNEESALDVQSLFAVVAAETHDVAVFDRDIDLEPLLGEHGEHPTTRQHEVGRLIPPRDSHPMSVDDGKNRAPLSSWGNGRGGRIRTLGPRFWRPML